MHAGDVTPSEAYDALANDPDAVLVDVRTRAEWTYVGAPDLSSIGKRVVLLEWQGPDGTVHGGFVDALRDGGIPEEAAVYFICRSGARSASAAAAATAAGYRSAYNVAHGFEGPPDAFRHRGSVAGWKADGLPWQQS
jgi:rhodanese-related sulfurtransferase